MPKTVARIKAALLVVSALLPASAAAAEELDPSKIYAVIAGVLHWKDTKHLKPFSARHRKDQELYDLLASRGVPKKQMALLLDAKATLKGIRAALKRLAAAAPKDAVLLFYFAGHGLKDADGSVYFANYDVRTDDQAKTGLGMDHIAKTIADTFNGTRVLLFADCCHSGGLETAAKSLAAKEYQVLAVTSAQVANVSTGNWTFTQALLDAFGGLAIVDRNDDGAITVDELVAEVSSAMKNREQQRLGYANRGVPGSWVLAKTRERFAGQAPSPSVAARGYVHAPRESAVAVARVLGAREGRAAIEFYDYSDKVEALADTGALRPIAFRTYPAGAQIRVKWNKNIYDAKVLRVDDDFHWITYPGWDESWNEWVMANRIVEGPAAAKTVSVEWKGRWYPATVLRMDGEQYCIHYAGYSADWDECVAKGRVRLPQ